MLVENSGGDLIQKTAPQVDDLRGGLVSLCNDRGGASLRPGSAEVDKLAGDGVGKQVEAIRKVEAAATGKVLVDT